TTAPEGPSRDPTIEPAGEAPLVRELGQPGTPEGCSGIRRADDEERVERRTETRIPRRLIELRGAGAPSPPGLRDSQHRISLPRRLLHRRTRPANRRLPRRSPRPSPPRER